MKWKKNHLKLFSLIFIILFCYVFQTIVYSAFSSTMNINGSAHARSEADVRITDFRLASSNNAISSYEEFGKSHIITEVNLSNSSSSITYYLEITNYGSVDVGIFDITGLPSGVSYSIKDYNLHDKICDDTGKCNNLAVKTYEITLSTTSTYSGNIQLNFDFRTYHKVTYTDIESKGYPTDVIDGGNLKITFKEDLKRVQVFSNGVEIGYYKQISNNQTLTFSNITNDVEVKFKEYVAKVVKGDINEVGSEVCIGEECFYVISNDGETVSMLAKYNLEVGNVCTSSSSCTPIVNPSGLQNATMIGYPTSGNYPRYGPTSFSSTNYWSSTISNYPTYVYNENSTLYNYVENYKTYLENQGAEIEEARLIKLEELEALGCSGSDLSCKFAPSWVYATSYWVGSAPSSTYVWNVYSIGAFSGSIYSLNYNYGCRPVIEVPVNEISPLVRAVSGDGTNVGDEICIGDECFYTISSDDDSITMLAKYNLEVGNVCTSSSSRAPIPDSSGIQDAKMIGYPPDGSYPRYGTANFSSSKYWGSASAGTYVYDSNSNLYNYVENYRTYLENQGSEIEEARLIKKEELEVLGCSSSSNSCLSAPEWVYGTSYWSGSISGDVGVWIVSSEGEIASHGYSVVNALGVRPVITIPKWIIGDTIEFTINDVTYQARENMTWQQWINSSYNTIKATYNGDMLWIDASTVQANGKTMYLSDIIEDSTKYTYVLQSGGSND